MNNKDLLNFTRESAFKIYSKLISSWLSISILSHVKGFVLSP